MELERRNTNMADTNVSDNNICSQEIHIHKDTNIFYIWFKYDKAENIFFAVYTNTYMQMFKLKLKTLIQIFVTK